MRHFRTPSIALVPALLTIGVAAQEAEPVSTTPPTIEANAAPVEAPVADVPAAPTSNVPAESAIARLPELLNAEGIVRFSRMRQKGTAAGVVPWTVTAGSTATATFLCFEGPAPLPRCFDIAAPAHSFLMPFEPRNGFPLRVGVGVPVAEGDIEEMLFQLASPEAEPGVALSNFVGTARAGARLPTITVRNRLPAVVLAAGNVEVMQRQGPVMYALEGGMLSACERNGEAVRCTTPVRVAQPEDVVVLEPDAQGPSLFEVELEVYQAGSTGERIHVAVFDRSADGALDLAALVPFGGETRVTDSSGSDIREVMYQVLEPAGEGCLRIGRPETEHRMEASDGAERPLARLRLARAPDVLPPTVWNGDSLLVDSSGTWQVNPSGGLRRVSRCPR